MNNIFDRVLQLCKDQLNPSIRTNEEVEKEESNKAIRFISMDDSELFFADIDIREELKLLNELSINISITPPK